MTFTLSLNSNKYFFILYSSISFILGVLIVFGISFSFFSLISFHSIFYSFFNFSFILFLILLFFFFFKKSIYYSKIYSQKYFLIIENTPDAFFFYFKDDTKKELIDIFYKNVFVNNDFNIKIKGISTLFKEKRYIIAEGILTETGTKETKLVFNFYNLFLFNIEPFSNEDINAILKFISTKK